MTKKMELLSPAGNLETALAAFDGGADAVYCGLGKFNARERAANFSSFDMGRLIRFAHKNGKKVYVTFNTLVKEKELAEAAEFLAELADLAPDALIVQDLGIAAMIRNDFPTLVMHASTQMGIHNSAGIAFAQDIGFRRVILERQITLQELQQMLPRSPLEIEVFLHGSLCCSLSGRCLLSAAQGGYSGNRGKCKQPCRRTYYAGTAEGRFLSPRDLDGTSVLPELRRLGVASLKIEGRLRSPDYVWKTAHAYRLLLDGPVEPEAERLEEAQKWLAAAASRRPSGGFYLPNDRLIDETRPGSFGLQCAAVLAKTNAGIQIKTCAKLHLGDRLRAVPPDAGEGDSFSLIKMEKRERGQILKLGPGETAFIPGKFPFPAGTALFKIGENAFDYSRQAASLPAPGRPFTWQIRLSAKHFSARIAEMPDWIWEKDLDFAPAEKRPVTAEALRELFLTGSPEKWLAKDAEITVEGKFFAPASELKSLRRECCEKLAATSPDRLPDAGAKGLWQFYQNYRKRSGGEAIDVSPDRWYFPPDFTPERTLPVQQSALQNIVRSGRPVYAGNCHVLAMLDAADPEHKTEICAGFPLPVANSEAAELLKELFHVTQIVPEAELSAEEIADLAAHCTLKVWKNQPRPVPLLVTRAKLPQKRFRDRNGMSFTVKYNPETGLSELYADHLTTSLRIRML